MKPETPKVLVVIPARLESTRLPRKALLKESGKYLIQHVYEQVQKAKGIDRIIVAADSEEIADACSEFGAECILTSSDHQSGTDRIAEAVEKLRIKSQSKIQTAMEAHPGNYLAFDVEQNLITHGRVRRLVRLEAVGLGCPRPIIFYSPLAKEKEEELYNIVINVQGDEPEINPKHIEKLATCGWWLEASIGTLAEEISFEEATLLQVVKVVFDKFNRALYFSRSIIPHPRNEAKFYRHIGIYAYASSFLRQFVGLKQSPLEIAEGLEQLRALYYGHDIYVRVVESGSSGRGVDTREDYDEFLERIKNVKT